MTNTEIPEPFPGHDAGRWLPAVVETVASWPAGHLAENLAVSQFGSVFVSLHTHNRIDCFDPISRKVSAFAVLPAPVA